ncbi:MAG TPA: surface-adhesin E family protein [Candidatus Saccharimonadales bacterium]|nr:surface-adhesin E family protein [Candidatus Saccharimonadales bacterium]
MSHAAPLNAGVRRPEAKNETKIVGWKMQPTVMLLILLPLQTYSAQEKDQWQRLYTFDSATVDISTTNIWFGSDFTGRVRFRLRLSKPEPVSMKAKAKYQVAIETMELRCEARQYRVVEEKLYDSKDKPIAGDSARATGEWKRVEPRSMMDKYFEPGCGVIYKKKQNP